MRELTDRQVEALISHAVSRSTPDIYKAAAHTPVKLEGAPESDLAMQTARKPARPAFRAAMGLCACLALVLSMGLFQFFHTAAVIGIDVNPSIELTANRFDKVLDVRPLNADAEVILGEMKLRYMDLDTALNAIVGSMVRNGYFTPGQHAAVLVSVSGGDQVVNDRMRQRVALDIESVVTASGGTAAILTQDVTSGTEPPSSPAPSGGLHSADAKERAARSGISYGKQIFIDRLLTLDPSLDERALISMSIGQIAALVQERGLDLGLIVDFDDDDSTREMIEDFIEDVDEEAQKTDSDRRDDSGDENGDDDDDDNNDYDDDDDDDDNDHDDDDDDDDNDRDDDDDDDDVDD